MRVSLLLMVYFFCTAQRWPISLSMESTSSATVPPAALDSKRTCCTPLSLMACARRWFTTFGTELSQRKSTTYHFGEASHLAAIGMAQ